MPVTDNQPNNEASEKEAGETEHLMSTEANRRALDESIKQLALGLGVKVSLDDLWK